MDFYNLTIGLLAFIIAFILAFLLLQRHNTAYKAIVGLMTLSGLGHMMGAFAYYAYTAKMGSDSLYYFTNATTKFDGLGYHFAFFIMGYLRSYVIGDSLLGAFLLFSSLAFLGSVFYFLAYKLLLDKLSHGQRYYLLDPSLLIFPAALLLCWPSYFFWSAGLVKDNFAFLSIGMFLYCLARNKITFSSVILLIIASVLAFLIRPYLFITVSTAAIIFIFFGSKWNMAIKIGFLICIAYVSTLLMPQLTSYSSMIRFSGASFEDVANFAIRQQSLMSVGSSIPLPSSNPKLIFLFLPYLFSVNLFFPLFIGANNVIGLLGSIENILFLCWTIYFFKNKMIWNLVKNELKITKFFLIYFIVGMSFLSMVNTNLGLAMREKMMYVPAFLIVIFLVYAYKKILTLSLRNGV